MSSVVHLKLITKTFLINNLKVRQYFFSANFRHRYNTVTVDI